MAKENAINFKERTVKFINRFSNQYLVMRNLLGFVCFTIAFSLFLTYAYNRGDLVKAVVAVGGIILMLIGLGLIVEFIVKTIALENNPNIKRFSAILSVNLLLGLAFPLFLINLVGSAVINLFHQMHYYGTFFCSVRVSIVNFYYWNQVYDNVDNFIKIVVVLSLLLLVIGGFWERNLGKK